MQISNLYILIDVFLGGIWVREACPVKMRRTGLVSALVVLVVAAAALMGSVRTGAAGTDPEPWMDPNQQYQFDKGPGWPAGWTEPAAPTDLTDKAKAQFAELEGMGNPPLEHLAFRILSPMPAWTKEYPYIWMFESITCGGTMYAYYMPYPDTRLIQQAFDESYAVFVGPHGGAKCQFSPVTEILYNAKQTPEEKEQQRLDDLKGESIYYAKHGLMDCNSDLEEGTPDHIFVCFNTGVASDKFDVPAYLDTSVGRVRVPIRFVSEMMGATVDWDGPTQTVTIHFPVVSRDVVQPVLLPGFAPLDLWTKGTEYLLDYTHFKWALNTVNQPERTIVLTVGNNKAFVDGHEVAIDAPPVVLPPGRTMVPVRFIAEAMGAKVYWVGSNPIFPRSNGSLGGRYQVHIFTSFWPYFESPNWYLETRAVKF